MGIGLCFGRSDLKEGGPPKEVGEIPYSTPYERTQDLAAEMFDRFEQFWGTAECRSIQVKVLGRTMDAADPDVKKMMESGEYFDMLSKVCCNVSASAARIAAEIILLEIEREKNWYRFDQRCDFDYKPTEK